jgi:hypothetical protein
MSSLGDVPVFVQPILQMKTSTAAKIAAGTAYQIGGVVREVGSGRLVELLQDAVPLEEVAKQSASKVAQSTSKVNLSKVNLTKIDAKTAGKLGGLVLLGGAAVGGYVWVKQQFKDGEPAPADVVVEEVADEGVEGPECLVSFRASLKAYVDAGVEGRLDPDIIGQLGADLRAVEAYSSEGAVVFTFDELMPFFELVTAHTPMLAKAYNVEFDEAAFEGGDIVSLRRHLEAQRRMLESAA